MTFKSVTDAFAEFLSNSKREGKIIMCMEDGGIRPPARGIRREGHDRDLRLGPHVELGRGGSVAP